MKFSPQLALLVLLLILLGGFVILQRSNHGLQTFPFTSLGKDIAPTPFPFEEMTIPYLRKKMYKSALGEGKLISDNGSYSSYLTSYTSDGLKINALLTIPTGQEPPGFPHTVQKWPASNALQPARIDTGSVSGESNAGWPAIVFVHGYIPPSQYVTTERYVDYVDYLARNGFVVLKIDLRGHGESEGRAGGGYFGSDYVVDTLNAYAALQQVSYVDPKKIGLWGHSMAGNILLRSLAVKPSIPAAVIWAGAVYSYEDQRKYGINDQSFRSPQTVSQQLNRRRELYEKYGSPSAESVFWQQVAPTNYLSDLKGAIQIDHALDDAVVNIGYSKDLIKLLDKTKVPHEFYEYPSGGHNITGENFDLAMQRTVDFFKKYLK